MAPARVSIENLMKSCDVRFGTSGARGLVTDMSDRVCYAYTRAFLQYLEEAGELQGQGSIAIGGDLRSSTDRIMRAVAKAVEDSAYTVENCGFLPSPALAHHGLARRIPTVMVTGSHIPEDRNGIKYNRRSGEILKEDEAGIKGQTVALPEGLFDDSGMFVPTIDLPPISGSAAEAYKRRYLDGFPEGCLKGRRVGVYQHSSVGRELMVDILSGLGADVTPLGISGAFIPVDTEALRSEDCDAALRWSAQYGFHSIVSADGDGDRPLISDEQGKWLRGDVAGILCASYLHADAVVIPVSSNTAAEKCGLFDTVERTRIGSPFVIRGMERALTHGAKRVVGYEANGGFLTATDIESRGKTLVALPTRDAMLPIIAVLLLSLERRQTIRELVSDLPQRFTASGRLKDFPSERSMQMISQLHTGDAEKDRRKIEDIFSQYCGPLSRVDTTDGLRLIFQNNEIVHLRPSGNAPEFRCYNEADTESRANQMNAICLDILESWR